MLRIFSAVAVFGILCLATVLIVGFVADPYYEKTSFATYMDDPSKVWNVLTDIEKYPESKKDVQQVEILERNFGAINKWREIISEKESREYEIIRKDSPHTLVLKKKNSKTSLEGTWTYYISREGDRTKLTITEESTIEDLFWRGVLTIFDRSSNINYEFKWLRVKLFEDLLKS